MNGDKQMNNGSPVVHVEVAQKLESMRSDMDIKADVENFLLDNMDEVLSSDNKSFSNFDNYPNLKNNVTSVQLDHTDEVHPVLGNCQLLYHIFKLDAGGCQTEDLEEEEHVHASSNWVLPSRDFHGAWETLIYDSDIKESLLRYVKASLTFSDRNVDSNLITWNKVLLLHGPPGTGKTSLCRALAHKIAVRMSHRYKSGQLIEINSHSLFSKWFSESGKLVQRMFESIEDFVADPEVFVCVLVDEIESLAAARQSHGNDPSDAIRVVNAVLTQLDKIKRHPNVLVLTTSNITGCIDLAFVDRADMKKYIGLPSKAAVYEMLKGSVDELGSKGLIEPAYFISYPKLIKGSVGDKSPSITSRSRKLAEVAETCVGLSGRSIRKLPLVAYANIMDNNEISVDAMLQALIDAANEQKCDRKAHESIDQ